MPDPIPFAFASLNRRRTYLVGVSGGCDSMVLLGLLAGAGFRRLVVCHLDHRLRGRASRADARLVESAARRLGCAFELGEADTAAHAARRCLSTEAAGRELRHAFFASCARTHRCRTLLLAHHADDQVETCLFNFLRGTGAAGLAGMRSPARVAGLTVIRPLLAVSRDEILAAAKARRIRYRDDASNRSPAHARNRLRLDVLPAIDRAVGPSFRSAVLRAADILRAESAWIEEQVPRLPARPKCATLRALPLVLRRRAILQWLRDRGVPEAGFAETERVLSLLASGPARVNLPGGHHARRRAGEIFFE